VDLRPTLDLQLGHRGAVVCAAFAPDGKTLATGSSDDTLRIWDVATGEVRQTLTEHTWNVRGIVFAPDGQTFVTGSGDGRVRVWDARLRTVQQTWEGHGKPVNAVAFAPDGQTVASGSDDQTVKLWNARSGALQRTLTGHSGVVFSMAFSADGKTLASGSFDGTVRLWDARTGEPIRTLEHGPRVFAVACSPDGRWIASGSEDGTVRVWDAATGALRRSLAGSTYFMSVAFSPDGRTIACGGADRNLRLWDVQTGALQYTLTGHVEGVRCVAFSPDSGIVASASQDKTIVLWDAQAGERLRTLGRRDEVRSVAFSPDGGMLASGGRDGSVRLWDARDGRLQRALTGLGTEVWSVAFSPDSARVAGGSLDGAARIWDAQSGVLLHTLAGHGARVTAVAFSPDGKTVASGSWDNQVRLWDARSGAFERALPAHISGVHSVAFSPDGATLAVASADRTVQLWDVARMALRSTLTGHGDIVRSVAFSPDSKTLASGSTDRTVRLWDAETGALQRTLTHDGAAIYAIAFAPDGKRVAAGSEYLVRVWNTASGALEHTFAGHTSGVWSVAFSPDGRTLASAGSDTTVKLWDTRQRRLLLTLLALPPEDPAGTGDARPTRMAYAMAPIAGTRGGLIRDKPITIGAKPVAVVATAPLASEEYLAFTPEGYYAGSPAADRVVRFRLGPDLFAAECFQARYHRPELVVQALAGQPLPSPGPLKGTEPPTIAFVSHRSGDRVRGESLQVTLEATDDSDVTSVALFVNGARADSKPITVGARPISVGAKPITVGSKPITVGGKPIAAGSASLPSAHRIARRFTATLPLPPDERSPRLQAIAFDDDGMQSPRREILVSRDAPAAVTGELLGLCVGVSRYRDAGLNLQYADRDATALADALNRQRGIYRKAEMAVLTDEQAHRQSVTAALDRLAARATRADTVVLFFSGHGWRSDTRSFYFATHEVDRTRVAETALSWNEVVRRLQKLSEKTRRVLVLLDACHSGSAATNEELVKAVLTANAGVMVFSSSRGSEVSIESAELGHGAFTQALLEAVNGRAAPLQERSVTLWDFASYVRRRVKELTHGTQNPQVPFLQDFDTDAAICMRP
jgi:WD40 repeat protein